MIITHSKQEETKVYHNKRLKNGQRYRLDNNFCSFLIYASLLTPAGSDFSLSSL